MDELNYQSYAEKVEAFVTQYASAPVINVNKSVLVYSNSDGFEANDEITFEITVQVSKHQFSVLLSALDDWFAIEMPENCVYVLLEV
jgi:hypothetical protein